MPARYRDEASEKTLPRRQSGIGPMTIFAAGGEGSKSALAFNGTSPDCDALPPSAQNTKAVSRSANELAEYSKIGFDIPQSAGDGSEAQPAGAQRRSNR